MIKEKKSKNAPASLSTTKQYNGEDVYAQLMKDQHEKCYICERKLVTDYEVEHFKSENNYPELVQEWTNLFLACRYCNGKKSNSFDDNVYPLTTDVEEEISQRIDFGQNKAVFSTSVTDVQHDNTVRMLNLFYNGKGDKKLRNLKEERFFNYAKQKVIDFMKMVNDYLVHPTESNWDIVAEELDIDKELLGFKYWIIRDYNLSEDFKNNIIWNK
ncbi:MAG TPA: HNH endonuclease [Candidatus Paraprevotella stercorigallinarum]|nr:HNH endonuclease [Candidatus Paraprevotella stercorigallinarum]